MPAPDLPTLLAFAATLADLARPIARRHFRAQLAVATKADRTPVTAADRAIERALRERIAAQFPAHGVLGEEEGPDRPDAEFVWVIDPIDGTKAFAGGNPLFGTLIGLAHRGRPVVGVLDARRLRQAVAWTCWGGDCIAYGLLARGGADLLVDRGLKAYDWCALVPIVSAAGGVITDWCGGELALDGGGDVVAAGSREVLDAARLLLRDAGEG